MDLILDPPGLPWGSLFAPKMLETCLEIPPGRPKSRSKDLFFGSKRRNTGFQKRGQKRDPLAGLRWVQDGMTGGRCGPGLSSFELEYACICARSWKHAQHHQRWAADRSRAFRQAWGLGSRALGEGAFSEERCQTWFQNSFEMVPKL